MRKSISNSLFGKIGLALPLLAYLIIHFYKELSHQYERLSEVDSLGLWPAFQFKSMFQTLALNTILMVLVVWVWGNMARKFKLIEGGKWPLYYGMLLSIAVWPVLISSSMLFLFACCFLAFVYFFMQINNQASIKSLVFIGSMFIAIGGFFFYASPFFLLVFWFGIALIRPFDLRTYLLSLLGFLLPFIYYYSLSFILGNPVNYYSAEHTNFGLFRWLLEQSNLGPFIFLLIFLALGLYNLGLRAKMIVLVRNQKAFLLACLLLSVVLGVFWRTEAFFISAFPASVFLQNFYREINKKWIAELLISILLLGLTAELLLK